MTQIAALSGGTGGMASMAESRRRQLTITSNGVLWAVLNNPDVQSGTDGLRFYYSTDSGATWTEDVASRAGFGTAGSLTAGNRFPSLYVDQDDFAHLVYFEMTNTSTGAGIIRYRRGTPNAGRTSWTWNAATQLGTLNPTAAQMSALNVVAARRPGTSPQLWDVFVTMGYFTATNSYALYLRLALTSTGTVNTQNLDGVTALNGWGALVSLASANANIAPSGDIRHNGDGRTSTSPDFFVAYGTATGNGISASKFTYNGANSWVQSSLVVTAGSTANGNNRLSAAYDGTRFLVAYPSLTGANGTIAVWEIPGATFTGPTTRTSPAFTNVAAGITATALLTVDGNTGDYYVRTTDATSHNVYRDVFTRASTTWGTWTLDYTRTQTTTSSENVSSRTVADGYGVDLLALDGNTWNTSTANFTRLALHAPPLVPTLTLPSNTSYVDGAAPLRFTGTYNPQGASGTMNAWALRQKISGAGSYLYWNAGTNAWQSTIVWNTGTVLDVTIPVGGFTNGNIYNWSFATQESGAGLQGPFATDFTFTAQPPPSTVVNSPTGSITTTSTPTITWTDTIPSGLAQINYRVVVESGAFGATPGAGVTAWDSGVVTSSATTATVPPDHPLTNGVTYRFFVQVAETGGEVGAWSYSTATLALTPPSTPTLAATNESASGRIRLDVTAGAGGPGGTYSYIERSTDGGTTWTYVRTASPLTPLAYGGSVTTYDYEAPPSQALLYRVTTILVTLGNVVYSLPSASVAVTLVLTSAWLKDPTDPTRNIALSCLAGVTSTRGRAANVLTPLGASYPVVQVDARQSRALSVEATPSTQAEADAIDRLLTDTAATLLLQRPAAKTGWRGLNLYFVVSGDDTNTPLGDVPTDVTTLSFPVTEVPVPVLV